MEHVQICMIEIKFSAILVEIMICGRPILMSC